MNIDFYLRQWSDEFGNKYTRRCNVNYKDRLPIIRKIFSGLFIQNTETKIIVPSVLEVGCNRGHNLMCFDEIGFNAFGVEPNSFAINESKFNKKKIVKGNLYDIPYSSQIFDLTLTIGVLIHIPTKKLNKGISELRRVSKKNIAFIEYESDIEIGKKYRDFHDEYGVWSRPYGLIYQNKFPVDKLKAYGKIKDIGSDNWGFTDCSYWIFEKNIE